MGFRLSFKLLRDQVKSNRQTYLPTLVMGSILVALVYIIFAMGDMIAGSEGFVGYRSLGTVFKTLTYVFAIISFAVFFYLNAFLAKRRSLSYGLYGVLGLGKRDLIKLNFLECLGLCFSISLLGSILGFALGRLAFAGLLALTHLDDYLKISYQFSGAALRQAWLLFACIFLAIFLFNSFTILKAKLRDLLDGPETGEREPKAKWLLSILSLGLLLGAYYLANQNLDPIDAIKVFFPAVLMVIVGTYGVFMAVTIFLLKALKRNKHLYYKPRPFINISNLLFRMKANAAGLATISILFTCAFLTFSTTSTLYWGVAKNIEGSMPREVVFDQHLNITAQVDKSLREQVLDRVLPDLPTWNQALAAKQGYTLQNELLDVLYAEDTGMVTHSLDVAETGQAGRTYHLVYRYAFDMPGLDLDERQAYFAAFYGESSPVNKLASEGDSAPILQPLYSNISDREEMQQDLWSSMGTLLFIGLYFILFFLLVSGLVVYFKQVNEAYADRENFIILQELGLEEKQVKATIRTQILIMFFLPLAFSVLNVVASYKILNTLLQALGTQILDGRFFLKMSVVSVLVFTLIYLLIYQATAHVYYRIVQRKATA